MKKNAWLAMLAVLVLVLGSMGMAQAEIIPPQWGGQFGDQAVVLCESLTVRQSRSTSSKAVTTLEYGRVLSVLSVKNGWGECILSDDVNASPAGWVNVDYLAFNPAWCRTEAKTPVYAWNDTGAPKVALLDAGTSLPILKDDGTWLVVSLRGAVGWIRRSDVD